MDGDVFVLLCRISREMFWKRAYPHGNLFNAQQQKKDSLLWICFSLLFRFAVFPRGLLWAVGLKSSLSQKPNNLRKFVDKVSLHKINCFRVKRCFFFFLLQVSWASLQNTPLFKPSHIFVFAGDITSLIFPLFLRPVLITTHPTETGQRSHNVFVAQL